MENFNSKLMRNQEASRESFNSNLNGSNPSLVFQNEENFKDFIKSNLKRPKVSREFIQSIKDKVKVS